MEKIQKNKYPDIKKHVESLKFDAEQIGSDKIQ